MNSSAALRIAARVRSDFVTLGAGCGNARRRDDDCDFSDIVSDFSDTLSAVHKGKHLGQNGKGPHKGTLYSYLVAGARYENYMQIEIEPFPLVAERAKLASSRS